MKNELRAIYISYTCFIGHLKYILKTILRLSEDKKSILITAGSLDFVANRIIFLM